MRADRPPRRFAVCREELPNPEPKHDEARLCKRRAREHPAGAGETHDVTIMSIPHLPSIWQPLFQGAGGRVPASGAGGPRHSRGGPAFARCLDSSHRCRARRRQLNQILPRRLAGAGRLPWVLSAFAPTGQTTRCRARLSGLQDAECDRRSAHVTKASRHRRHVLAHAGSDAQEISEFVVPPAIAPC